MRSEIEQSVSVDVRFNREQWYALLGAGREMLSHCHAHPCWKCDPLREALDIVEVAISTKALLAGSRADDLREEHKAEKAQRIYAREIGTGSFDAEEEWHDRNETGE